MSYVQKITSLNLGVFGVVTVCAAMATWKLCRVEEKTVPIRGGELAVRRVIVLNFFMFKSWIVVPHPSMLFAVKIAYFFGTHNLLWTLSAYALALLT